MENTEVHMTPQEQAIERLKALQDLLLSTSEWVSPVKGQFRKDIAFAIRAIEELSRLNKEVEQLRVQLAGCGVEALGYGKECNKGDYGWSASLGDVRRIRLELSRLREVNGGLREAFKEYVRVMGPAHENECPQDDTCACKWKPLNNKVNAVLAETEKEE